VPRNNFGNIFQRDGGGGKGIDIGQLEFAMGGNFTSVCAR